MADVEAIAQGLLALDENDLMAQIGARSQAIDNDPEAASVESLEEEVPVPRGAFDDLLKMGKDIFAPASAQAYKLLCTPLDTENNELVAELNKLLNEKTADAAAKMTAAIAPVLVGSLGLPQSIAVLVGSLIVKKIAKGVSDFACENWKLSLEGGADADVSGADPASPSM